MRTCLVLSVPILSLLALSTAACSAPAPAPKLGYGHRWIRSRPLTTMALVLSPKNLNMKQYRKVCNTLLAWKPNDELFAMAGAEGVPWHGHAKPRRFNSGGDRNRFSAEMRTRIREIMSKRPGCSGWMVWDEPQRTAMPTVEKISTWLRDTFPGVLVYTNGLPMGARRPSKYYGKEPPGGKYPYEQYMRDLVTICKPDVVGFDVYPFKESGKTSNFFGTVAITRKVALEAGIPYWVFVQSHQDPRRGYRMPSESDVRMQVFAHLTYGYTGIMYFTYSEAQGPGMVERSTARARPIYYHVARLNGEAENVGKALRFLTSTDVRVVACNGNKVRNHLVAWTPGAGGIDEIKSVTIDDKKAADYKDVLLGFFRDDAGRKYFMVTNLWHGKGASAAERRVTVRLKLDSDVEVVGRLSRETGAPELLEIADGELLLTLPGGTGELLRIGNAEFPGLDE